MGKVTVTKVQADAIELLLEINGGNKERTLRAFLNEQTKERKWDTIRFKSLDETKTEVFIKALYIGYEIEPEFKVGDWVATKFVNTIGKTTKIVSETGEGWLNFDNGIGDVFEAFRHATLEGIAEEKQRRFWQENDREVWELKEEDVLEYLGDPYIVDWFDSENVSFGEGPIEYMESFDFVKEHFKVFCFAEDRKDIKND